jgi:hypothetical protein
MRWVTGMQQQEFSSFCDLLENNIRIRFLSKDNRAFLDF